MRYLPAYGNPTRHLCTANLGTAAIFSSSQYASLKVRDRNHEEARAVMPNAIPKVLTLSEVSD